MKAGGTERFHCVSCNIEFDIIYEPNLTDNYKGTKRIDDTRVGYCPFCGNAIEINSED